MSGQSCLLFLQYNNVEVQIVASSSSLAFFDADEVQKSAKNMGKTVRVWKDEDEWNVRRLVSNRLEDVADLSIHLSSPGRRLATQFYILRCLLPYCARQR